MNEKLPTGRGIYPHPTYWCTKPEADLPENFVPLRLVLIPSEMSVEIRRTNVLLGRHSDSDLRLPLPDVSRHHCRLQFRDGDWYLIDLESLNGVHLNNEMVDESARITDGDEIRVGGFIFRVEHLEAGSSHVDNREEDMLLSISRALPPRGEDRRPAA